MSKRWRGWGVCPGKATFLAAALLAASAAQAETLVDAVALAYQSNPALLTQRAQLRIIDEGYVQARAGYRPEVSISAEASYQDLGGLDGRGADLALSATQRLYTGGRVSAAVTAAQGDILAGREALRQVEASVLQAVIQAYVDVRRDQQALAIRQENVTTLRQQVEESQTLFEVGQITRTDVAQAQASEASARALLAQAEAQLAISRAAYAAVVGQAPGTLDLEPPLPIPTSPEAAFATADRNNPNLRSALYREQASRARVDAARAERLPQVGLRATVGYSSTTSSLDLNDRSRSVTAAATVSQPLFAGGVINSLVRQAVERNASDRIAVEQSRRDVTQRLAQAWNQLLAARAGITAGQEQVRAARIAYEGTQEERKVGLRTTLEVLTAQQNQRDAELALLAARRDDYVATAAVLNVMGDLEARVLAPGAPAYDPAKAFDKVRNAGFLPWEPVIAGLDSIGAPRVQPLPSGPSAPVATSTGR